MSKELTKFKSEYDKKIKPKLKAYGKAEASKLSKRIGIANGAAWEGEDVLMESMVPAHSAGISGGLSDFMKNKEFKEGYTLYKKSVEMLAQDLSAAEQMQKEAKEVLAAATKLDADITKDLKKRKDKSQSKSDIEKLQKEVKEAIKELADGANVYDKQPPGVRGYPANFPKKVNTILKTPPDQAQSKKDSTELPQLMQDRNLKSNINKVKALIKTVNAKAEEAIEEAAKDIKGASGPLKEAAAALKDLKVLNDQYTKAATDRRVKDAIENSKDKAAIKKTIDTIQKSFTAAERKVRGTMTTIKKAA